MNVLLISPPIFDFYHSPHRSEPLGLLYIREALIKANHQVTILDATDSRRSKDQKIPKELEYLKEFYEKDLSLFSLHSHYKRFGDSFDRILKEINGKNYDIIGVSSLFSAYHPDVERLVKRIKETFDIPVVIGGTAITAQGEEILNNTAADYLIAGTGTESMPTFLEALEKKISLHEVPGLICATKDEVIINKFSKHLDLTIIPPRDKFRTFRGKKLAKTIFSTGCKNHCAFCSIHRHNDYQIRDISSIKKELSLLLKAGVEIVDIEDDDIFSQQDFTQEILPILSEFHKLGLSYVAMNGMTAGNISQISEKLADIGFIKLDLSLVCGSAVAGKNMNRPHGLEAIINISDKVKHKAEIEVFLVPGLPGTELKDTLSTMLELHSLGIKCGLSPLYLVPDVPMFEKTGIPKKKRLLRGSALYPFDDETRRNVASLLKIARFINYSMVDKESADYQENLQYFTKSLKRKKWFKKTPEGKWVDSFEFSIETDQFSLLSFDFKRVL